MKWQQLKALTWLRYRLFMVQFRKIKIGAKVVLGLLIAFVAFSTLLGGITTFLSALWLMPVDKPIVSLLVWDGIAGVFLIVWMIGFMSELQRAEPISIENLLHLPMSLRGAFLMNYLSSFASLTIVSLLPAMLGVCLAMPFVYGWKAAIAFPLLFGYLALITAITFQIRGWLARMMSNPKRRRAIIAGIFFGFIALCQVPGLLGAYFDNDKKDRKPKVGQVAQVVESENGEAPVAVVEKENEEQAAEPENGATETNEELDEDTDPEAIDEKTRKEKTDAIAKELREFQKKTDRSKQKQRAIGWLTFAHRLIPFGWLPLGAYRASEGTLWPAIVGLLGMLGLAGLSLAMSYRATVNFYLRAQRSKKKAKKSTKKTVVRNAIAKPFPWLPKRLGTIAKTNLSSMWRSPAVKMQLLVPYLVMIFPIMPLYKNRDTLPEWAAPLVGLGLVFFCIFMLFGFAMNIFGFDRHGFRSYMLLPFPRRDLLLAKNVSLIPIVLSQWGIALTAVMFVFPLKWYDLLACIAQMVSAYTLFCVMGNFVSTMFSFPVPTSAMKRVQPRWQAIVAQMVAFAVSPLAMLPVALPPLIDIGLRKLKLWEGFSLNLPLSLVITALALGFYWLMLKPASQLLWEKQRDVLLQVSRSE